MFFAQKASLVSSDIFSKYFKNHIMEIVDQEKVNCILRWLDKVTGKFQVKGYTTCILCVFLGPVKVNTKLWGLPAGNWTHNRWKVYVSIPTHVKTHSLFLPIDRLEHSWAGQLERGCWQASSCMMKQTVHDLINRQTWTTLLEPSW